MSLESQAAELLWKSDPTFVGVAKMLYGENVDFETVAKDLGYVEKMNPCASDVHAPNASPLPMRQLSAAQKKRLKNEIKKFQASSKVKRYGRLAADVAATGALAGTAAVAGSKVAPMAGKAGGELKAFGQLARGATSSGERKALLSQAPHALSGPAKVLGTAGGGTLAGVAAGENANQAHLRYQRNKLNPLKKFDTGVNPERKKKALAAGLIAGTTAEGLATYRAGKTLGTALHGGPGKVAAAGEFALQAGNAAVGLASARELARKKPKTSVVKSFVADLTPEQRAQVRAIVEKKWDRWDSDHAKDVLAGNAKTAVGIGAAGKGANAMAIGHRSGKAGMITGGAAAATAGTGLVASTFLKPKARALAKSLTPEQRENVREIIEKDWKKWNDEHKRKGALAAGSVMAGLGAESALRNRRMAVTHQHENLLHRQANAAIGFPTDKSGLTLKQRYSNEAFVRSKLARKHNRRALAAATVATAGIGIASAAHAHKKKLAKQFVSELSPEQREFVRYEISKYYSEERSATSGELSQLRSARPIRSKVRPNKYKSGLTYSDDDGNRIVSPGGNKSSLGNMGVKRVKSFSNEVGGEKRQPTQFGKRHEVTWQGEISKADPDKRQVFGWASVTHVDGAPVVDLQGDMMMPEELEKAAYDYVLKSRIGGDMHARVGPDGKVISKSDKPHHVADLIESVVFTPEKIEKMGLPDDFPTGWWVGFKVHDDDVWGMVKKGERKGFSIHGLGKRVPVEKFDTGSKKKSVGYVANSAARSSVVGAAGGAAGGVLYGLAAAKGKAPAAGVSRVAHFGSEVKRASGLGAGAGFALNGPVGGAAGAEYDKLTTKLGVRVKRKPRNAIGSVGKSVGASNRMAASGASEMQMQDVAMQNATEMLAPQVAQQIMQLQQQHMEKLRQDQMQMQMMAQNQNNSGSASAQQGPMNAWATQSNYQSPASGSGPQVAQPGPQQMGVKAPQSGPKTGGFQGYGGFTGMNGPQSATTP